MRKFSSILAMLALLVTLGLAFVSCDDGVISGNEGGSNSSGSDNNTVPGTLTITDIPSQFNGMYARFYASFYLSYNNSLNIFEGAQSVEPNRDIIKCIIANNRVTLPIWHYFIFSNSDGSGSTTEPERQGSTYFILQSSVRKELIIGEYELYNHHSDTHESYIISFENVTIEFTNGSATISANLGTLSEQ